MLTEEVSQTHNVSLPQERRMAVGKGQARGAWPSTEASTDESLYRTLIYADELSQEK
jgi:hypothetical protein